VKKVPVGGGTPTTLVSSSGPRAIAVDATSVYFTDEVEGVLRLTPK
jgi:hypothetical protein